MPPVHHRCTARPSRRPPRRGARVAALAIVAALAALAACAGEPPAGATVRGPTAAPAAPAAPVAPAAGRDSANRAAVGARVGAEAAALDGLVGREAVPDDLVGIGVAYDASPTGMLAVARGVALAVAQLNARGELRFVARANAPGVVSAVQSATELREDPRVVGVVGHSESGTTLEAIPVYEDVEQGGRRALVVVSPTATSPQLSGRSDWFFRICPSDLTASRAAARYALDSLGARRAAVVYSNDSYGRAWTREFAAEFTAGGGQLVQRDPYLAGITEWGAFAGYMQLRGADVFAFPGSGVEDAEAAIRALRAIGARIPFVGGDAASALAEAPEEFAGARFTAFFDARTPTTPAARAFVTAFERTYGVRPDQQAALAYDAAMLIGEAALATGGDRRAIRDWIAELGYGTAPLPGVVAPMAFDERHDPRESRVIIAEVASR